MRRLVIFTIFPTPGLSNSAARQRNIKQKFVALLRRFKVTEPEDLRRPQQVRGEHLVILRLVNIQQTISIFRASTG